MTPRQRTVFHLCKIHEPYFAWEGGYRLAEFFAEGGPLSACAEGDACKVRPGRDLFDESVCQQRAWYDTSEPGHPFSWKANQATAEDQSDC